MTSLYIILFLSCILFVSPLAAPQKPTVGTSSRRDFGTVFAASTLMLWPNSAIAAKMPPDEALPRIKYELEDPNGGISFMRSKIESRDFAGLLEFTKTYDQNLRKTAMGGLKLVIEDRIRATELANSVTFDLIGINRSSRPGQESADGATKYLNELVSDVNEFLALPREN